MLREGSGTHAPGRQRRRCSGKAAAQMLQESSGTHVPGKQRHRCPERQRHRCPGKAAAQLPREGRRGATALTLRVTQQEATTLQRSLALGEGRRARSPDKSRREEIAKGLRKGSS
eukprot:4634815-Pleurochrysis_carterae.AAC.1